MVDPVLALSVFATLVLVAVLLFWPRLGLVMRLLRMSDHSEQVLLEDALKHVYTCESMGRECTLESLAGQLEVSTGRAAALHRRLAEAELIRSEEAGPRLTAAGRDSALRLVRSHRLWERYLADRTGVPPGEWHAEAERMEHALSVEETEVLAARLGHPAWDPHGDPIPTAGGHIPRTERLSLAGAEAGRTVEIVHLEDEPSEIYDALLEDGLDLGARLAVIERSDRDVKVRARGREWSIDVVIARNVTVRMLPKGESADTAVATLHDVRPGSEARVVGISPACQGSQRRRLLDLGVVRGTVIGAAFGSAAGDPVAYRIRGALIALRREQAEWIRVDDQQLSSEEVA
ncbi:MAG: metal-dependent transcriptional regulator [Gemmatimonadetes bacterium]|nr:metal-dependent transcriptional regulator [Gemmatimonadota bacterium]MDA1103922.1 metal-dependent transcriptional regulator [Gemmatimonadota bacterium]